MIAQLTATQRFNPDAITKITLHPETKRATIYYSGNAPADAVYWPDLTEYAHGIVVGTTK